MTMQCGRLLSGRPTAVAALFIVAITLSATNVRGADDAEAEIKSLIGAVEASGCAFIRNDTSHDAEAAAEHLRLKYRRGKRYADTAEHFIERLASKSSWSGRDYFIECGDTREKAGDWLSAELNRLRSSEKGATTGRE